jgi:hypothetical protein
MAEEINERRNYARADVQMKILFGQDTLCFSGIIDSISFGGVKIQAAHCFPVHSILKVKIVPRNDNAEFEAQVRVVWVQENKTMGAQFLPLRREQILLLEKIITPTLIDTDRAAWWD